MSSRKRNYNVNPAEYEPLSDAVILTNSIVSIVRWKLDNIGKKRHRQIRQMNINFLRGRRQSINISNLSRLQATIKNLESQL